MRPILGVLFVFCVLFSVAYHKTVKREPSATGVSINAVYDEIKKITDEVALTHRLRACAQQICGDRLQNKNFFEYMSEQFDNPAPLQPELKEKLSQLVDLKEKRTFLAYDFFKRHGGDYEVQVPKGLVILINAQALWAAYRSIRAQYGEEYTIAKQDFEGFSTNSNFAEVAFSLYKEGYFREPPNFTVALPESIRNALKKRQVVVYVSNEVVNGLSEVSNLLGLSLNELRLFLNNDLGLHAKYYLETEGYIPLDYGPLVHEETQVRQLKAFVGDERFHEDLQKIQVSYRLAYQKWIDNNGPEFFQYQEEDPNVVSAARSDALERLERYIRGFYSFLNSELRAQKMADFIAEIKAETKLLIQFKDKQVQDEFNRSVDEVSFYTIPSLQEVLAYVSSRADSDISLLKKELGLSDQEKALLALKDFYSYERVNNYGTPEQDARYYFSKAFGPSWGATSFAPSDRGVSNYSFYRREIQMSWHRLRSFSEGVGVAAHEMGHHVSRVLSSLGESKPGLGFGEVLEKNKIWEKRKCIQQYHGFTDEPSRHTEEDWADYFAALISKKMKTRHPWMRNFICGYLTETRDHYNVDYSLRDRPHAPDIFRLLHVEQHLGTISPSCKRDLALIGQAPCLVED